MDELLRIFVLGVEWFAIWLERSPLHVAWPVLFVALFQAFLSVVHVLQWSASCPTRDLRAAPPRLAQWAHRQHSYQSLSSEDVS